MPQTQIFKFYFIFMFFCAVALCNPQYGFAITKDGGKILTPLPLEKTLKSKAELKEFEELSLFMGLRNEAQIQKALKVTSLKASQMPPLAFYYLSHALAKQKKYEQAAFYFTVAQLRNAFDAARFPPYTKKFPEREELKNLQEDQKLNTPRPPAQIINPQKAFDPIIQNLTRDIREWIIQNPKHYARALGQAEIWDAATEYGYKPPYDIGISVDEKLWPELLKKTREDFFLSQRDMVKELEAAPKNQNPRPFGR